MTTPLAIVTAESKIAPNGQHVNRVVAVRDNPRISVKKGDLGGWVHSPDAINDNAWIADEGMLLDRATIRGRAVMRGNSVGAGQATIQGDAQMLDNAVAEGEALIDGATTMSENSRASGTARVISVVLNGHKQVA